MEIITSHFNSDFDSLAAMVAAQKLYPEAKLVFTGSQNKNVREFLSLHQEVLDLIDLKQLDKSSVKRMIVVDTRIASRLGELEELAEHPDIEIFSFDHHPPTNEDMKTAKDFYEEVGATTTILVKILIDKKIPVSPFEATLFALGIHEDTGSLTYPTTTYEDAYALAFLMGQKANVNVISHFLSRILSEPQRELFRELLKTAHNIEVKGINVLFASAEINEYIDEVSILAHRLSGLKEAGIVFILVKMNDRIHIIGRSRINEVDVGAVLSKLGGGGHSQAASAIIKNKNFPLIEKEIIEELLKSMHQPLIAKQIMSSPVKIISASTTIQEASKLMRKYGYTGLPVLENGKLTGVISRRDIDKADHHGLGHAPVKGFMSHRVAAVKPEEPLHNIENLLTEEEISRLFVIEDADIIGIITRSDLLKALHGTDYIRGTTAKPASPKFTRGDFLQRIKTLLPHHLQKLLKDLGNLAEETGFNVYLVGGFVRDMIMNYPNFDIDLVVEGDGIIFAENIVKKLGGRLRSHRKFGTAVVILTSDFRIDIASARREFYEHPAALPQVELSSIRQDLSRRDFSINAMAIALNTPRFGELFDFFGGQKDIEKKQIRILHSLSFIEDPTRIFRAVRFEQRYGFCMEEQTEKLARKAVEMELVGELTTVRVRNKLILILSEEESFKAIERLDNLGVLKNIFPKIKVDQNLEDNFKKIKSAASKIDIFFQSKSKMWLVLLMIMLENLSEEELKNWCAQMKFRKVDTNTLINGIIEGPKIMVVLNSDKKLRNSRIYELLYDFNQESLVYMYSKASSNAKYRIETYITKLKDVKIEVNGKDLIAMGIKPSSIFNKALKKLLDAKLDGLVKKKEEEIEFIKNEIKNSEKVNIA
ncbi:MAG: CBS domain-containing protein [Actinobacteria bacterium]|nr:CBS domain-containing protein [Actinomycetota bacterium]